MKFLNSLLASAAPSCISPTTLLLSPKVELYTQPQLQPSRFTNAYFSHSADMERNSDSNRMMVSPMNWR
jgi:hypothetical protein